MSDYPKLLWKDGVELTVQNADEEAAKRAEGCVGHGESAAPVVVEPETEAEPASDPPTFGAADDDTGEEPTEGPADDDTHAKRSRKKK